MKLRNKTTGEVATLTLDSDGETLIIMKDDEMIVYGVSFEDLVQDWEDAPEEPKEFWCINTNFDDGVQRCWKNDRNTFCPDDVYLINTETIYNLKMFGNYFETKEEAEKAVEKLKAWKRLKDKGFRFIESYLDNNDDFIIKAKLGHVGLIDQPDISLIFGDEE